MGPLCWSTTSAFARLDKTDDALASQHLDRRDAVTHFRRMVYFRRLQEPRKHLKDAFRWYPARFGEACVAFLATLDRRKGVKLELYSQIGHQAMLL